jgi:hypothetical protein
MSDLVNLPANCHRLHLQCEHGEQPRAHVSNEARIAENGTSAASVLAATATLSHLAFGIVSGIVACGHGCLLLHRILLKTLKIWCVP